MAANANRAATPPAVDNDTIPIDRTLVVRDLELEEGTDISPGDVQCDKSPPKDHEIQWLDNLGLLAGEGSMTGE